MHRRLLALVVGFVLIVASCGDGGGTTVATPSTTTSSPAADAPSSIAPASTSVPAAEPDTSSPTSGPVSSDPVATDPPPSDPVATDPPAVEVIEPLPDVSVQDVAAGTRVNLASLLPADRPILLWMWAPH